MLSEERAAYILEKMAGISLRAVMAGKSGRAAEGMSEKQFKAYFSKGKNLKGNPGNTYDPTLTAMAKGTGKSEGELYAEANAIARKGRKSNKIMGGKKNPYMNMPSGIEGRGAMGRFAQLLGGGSKLRGAMSPEEARKVLMARIGAGVGGTALLGGAGYAARRALRRPVSNLGRNAGIAALLAGGGLGGYALSKQSSYAELEAWLQPGTCAK